MCFLEPLYPVEKDLFYSSLVECVSLFFNFYFCVCSANDMQSAVSIICKCIGGVNAQAQFRQSHIRSKNLQIAGLELGVLKAMTVAGPHQEGHLTVALQTLPTSVPTPGGKPNECVCVAESILTSLSLLKESKSLGAKERG